MKSLNNTNWVNSRSDLTEYVRLLLDDYKLRGQQWENSKLEGYLDAIRSYSQDIDGYYLNSNQGNPEIASWKLFADILKGATNYE